MRPKFVKRNYHKFLAHLETTYVQLVFLCRQVLFRISPKLRFFILKCSRVGDKFSKGRDQKTFVYLALSESVINVLDV